MHSSIAPSFRIQGAFKYSTKYCRRNITPIKTFTRILQEKCSNFFCNLRNLNIFISKQSTIHIRKHSQIFFQIRIPVFYFCIQYSEQLY